MPRSTDCAMRLCDRPEFAQKPKPLTCRGDATVTEAVARMTELNFGSVIVVDAERRVEGLMTERDIFKRLVNTGRDPRTTQVSEIMTSNPRLAQPEDDVVEWLRIMSNERFRRLPIVDAEGRIVAVMSQGDFVSYTWPELVFQRRSPAVNLPRTYPFLFICAGIMLYSLVLILLLRIV